jgi:hypothetical protein
MKLFVTMTDKFMSGWGLAAGKTNKYVVECDNGEQAETIMRNALKRPEMKHVSIRTSRPNYNAKNVLASFVTFNDLGDVWKR